MPVTRRMHRESVGSDTGLGHDLAQPRLGWPDVTQLDFDQNIIMANPSNATPRAFASLADAVSLEDKQPIGTLTPKEPAGSVPRKSPFTPITKAALGFGSHGTLAPQRPGFREEPVRDCRSEKPTLKVQSVSEQLHPGFFPREFHIRSADDELFIGHPATTPEEEDEKAQYTTEPDNGKRADPLDPPPASLKEPSPEYLWRYSGVQSNPFRLEILTTATKEGKEKRAGRRDSVCDCQILRDGPCENLPSCRRASPDSP